MNWENAKIKLKSGCKIRLPHWKPNSYWVLSKDGFGRIIWSDGTPAKVHLKQLEETTWEIYEEKEKSLSDEIVDFLGDGVLPVKSVKEAVKKLKKYMHLTIYNTEVINKTFGGALCSK